MPTPNIAENLIRERVEAIQARARERMNRETYPRSTRTVGRRGGRLPPNEPYPRTVDECLQEGRTYKPAALRALRDYRRSKPWRGTLSQRQAKIAELHGALCAAYGLTTRLELRNGPGSSDLSFYEPAANRIVLRGRLSVVTYLHDFGHALGYGEQGTCRWSINLFRRIFPHSFARLNRDGHMLTR